MAKMFVVFIFFSIVITIQLIEEQMSFNVLDLIQSSIIFLDMIHFNRHEY